jgi:cation diffusion facilitator CzcD-associated flavoprotein CzcO
MTTHIDTDYLVIGAGATAMAFVDTLLTESKATVTMVDRFHRPGGHWNMAYPYVRLHQPSAMYGVNSRPLGEDRIDKVGWNAGLYELASAAEICSYFDHIMQQTFQPSGRVSYFPMAEYTGDGTFHLTTSGKEYGVTARKIVDTTYQDVSVPAMRPPEFPVEDTITVVPPNDLPAIRNPYERYVVIGAGKTGIDACLWLLEQGLDPEDITWIMPRSPWLLDRALVQPIPLRHAEDIAIEYAAKHDAIMNAESVPDLFDRLDAIGALLRIDPDERPTAFRCATVSRSELEQLRRITDVVRLGRIKRITKTAIELNNGEIPTGDHVLHVDCTADAVKQLPPVPIFQNGRITLQSVRVCQPAFSAALVAHVETTCVRSPRTPVPTRIGSGTRFRPTASRCAGPGTRISLSGCTHPDCTPTWHPRLLRIRATVRSSCGRPSPWRTCRTRSSKNSSTPTNSTDSRQSMKPR